MENENLLPVAIVGAGTTGLTLAIELARRGIRCRVLDASPAPRTHLRGAVVLGRTMEILGVLGIEEAEFARGVRSRGVAFYSRGDRIGGMDLSSDGSRYDFELVLSGEEIEALLLERLAREGVEVEWGVELIDFTRDALSATGVFRQRDGRQEVLQATWMIGCDGVGGMTRRLLGECLTGIEEAVEWAVLDCRLEGQPAGERGVRVLLEHEVLALVPLAEDRWRFYFRPSSASSDLLADVQMALDLHLPGTVATNPTGPERFRAGSWIARRYRHGHVLLAGDEAHSWSPIEGHGLNTGIQDAHNLGWKLALIENDVCDDLLLDSYELERRSVAEAIVASGDRKVSILQEEDRQNKNLGGAEITEVARNPTTSRHWAEATSEFLATYRCSPIVSGDVGPRPHNPSPGDRLPAAGFVVGGEGEILSLRELCDRVGHTLFCILRGTVDDSIVQALGALRALVERGAALVKTFCVVAEEPAPGEAWADVWYRAEGTKPFDILGDQPASLLLVRPDLFVGFRSDTLEPVRVESYLLALRGGRTA